MNEHKMLKEICELIDYSNNYFTYEKDYTYDIGPYFGRGGEEYIVRDDHGMLIEADVREIIFTQDFMDKISKYLDNKNLLGELRNREKIGKEIILNLGQPVLYLYNALNLGTKK